MIKLRDALEITRGTEFYYLYQNGKEIHYRNGKEIHYFNIYTEGEIKAMFDLDNELVIKIKPSFSFYGEYEGLELHLK